MAHGYSRQVRLTRNGQLVGMRGRGDVNGATSLISAGDPRSATVMTSTECLCPHPPEGV